MLAKPPSSSLSSLQISFCTMLPVPHRIRCEVVPKRQWGGGLLGTNESTSYIASRLQLLIICNHKQVVANNIRDVLDCSDDRQDNEAQPGGSRPPFQPHVCQRRCHRHLTLSQCMPSACQARVHAGIYARRIRSRRRHCRAWHDSVIVVDCPSALQVSCSA